MAKKRTRVWPSWWEWDLEIVDHVHERMPRRNFTEVDLRRMMEQAVSYRPDVEEGRFIVETRFQKKPWEVVVEPIAEKRLLVVVTAYDVD